MGRSAQVFTAQWIDGDWRPSDAVDGIDVLDPSDESLLAVVPAGTLDDARRAAQAARAAQPRWAATPVKDRIAFVERLARRLSERAGELAEVIVSEVGAPVTVARQAQVGLAVAMTESFAELASGFAFERRAGNSLVLREPAGVVAAITPWNVPLLLTLQKVVPALLAGCAVVHKPSELTPLNAYLLAEITAECGLPPGVFNVVVGTGEGAGADLVRSPDVDMVSLTGSVRAGRQVASMAARRVKRVHLELGGKNAGILLDDADLRLGVAATVDQMCFNTGQACLQWSRLLVPADRHDEAAELAAGLAGRYRVGDPRDPDTDLGPLISDQARERVRGYIASGVAEGATLLAGGRGGAGGTRARLLRASDRVLRRAGDHDHRQGGDLRPGAVDHAVPGRGRGDRDRQQHPVRPARSRLVGRHRQGTARRHADAGRPGRHQRRAVQHPGALRRGQAVGHRPRMRRGRA
ncbi:hypothetical protein GCM10020001_043810 [Nonomuraea salmonea]